MSTCNFETMHDFPLYLWDITSENYNNYKSGYDFSDEENMSENDIYEEIVSCETSFICNTFNSELNSILNKFKKQLMFHDIIVKSGYYTGLQIFVELNSNFSDYCVHDSEDIENLDNEDTKYLFDMCRSQFLIKFYSEISYINKKVLPELAKTFGFEEYNCIGVFSNGEAIYEKADTLKGKLLAIN